MPEAMQTLKEISAELANKQPGMVDSVTEDAPVLAECKWTAATHGMWNAAEVVSDITGPGFVEANAPLPTMSVDSDIVQTHVSIMGGEVEVSVTTAARFGGPEKYFSKRQDALLKQAGMDTESRLYYNYFLKAALACGNVVDAGGVAGADAETGLSSLVFVRFDQDANVGIYDPAQFDSGRLLKIDPINGGNKYHMRSKPGVLGYGVSYMGRFGWQLLSPEKTVAAVVNISEAKRPSVEMLAKAINMVRGTPKNTRILCNPLTATYVFGALKSERLDMSVGDVNLNIDVKQFGDIPIIKSYNIIHGNEAAVA